MKKKKRILFLRSFYMTSVILICIMIAAAGIGAAYENTLRIGFGEYKKAIEIDDGFLRILDFKLQIPF